MTALKIEIDAASVQAALSRLAAASGDLALAMRAIASLLERRNEDNVAAQSGPLGRSPRTRG